MERWADPANGKTAIPTSREDDTIAPGQPHVRVADYLALVERSTFGDDRVRP